MKFTSRSIIAGRMPALCLASCLLLGACQSGVPSFQSPGFGSARFKDGVRAVAPADVAQAIACELRDIYVTVPSNTSATDWHTFLDAYLVSAALSLRVDDNGGFYPSLSFIDPYSTAMTNFTFGINAQASATRTRIFTETVYFAFKDFADPKNSDLPTVCGDFPRAPSGFHINGIDLMGSLGLSDIVNMGLGVRAARGASFPAVGLAPPGPAFASTIQFTLIKGAGVGPTWTVSTFKGPTGSGGGGGGGGGGSTGGATGGSGGSSGGGVNPPSGLLNYGRSDNHNVIVTFTPLTAASRSFTEDQVRSDAATRAQNMILDLRLQQLQ